MRIPLARSVVAGLIATTAMSLLMLMAPLAGFGSINISDLLASRLGESAALGWASQFLFGTLLALLYGAFFVHRLPGAPLIRGVAYGLITWAVEQVIIMPAIGIGFFSRSALLSIGSLVGHLVYGAVVGAICGAGARFTPTGPASIGRECTSRRHLPGPAP